MNRLAVLTLLLFFLLGLTPIAVAADFPAETSSLLFNRRHQAPREMTADSFSINRNSFEINGSPYIFDILPQEENSSPEKSRSVIMNNKSNPDHLPEKPLAPTDTPTTSVSPSVPEKTPPTTTTENSSVSSQTLECGGNIGCWLFKALKQVTAVIYLIIAGTHKIIDITLTLIEKALAGFITMLNRAIIFFTPEPIPAGASPDRIKINENMSPF